MTVPPSLPTAQAELEVEVSIAEASDERRRVYVYAKVDGRVFLLESAELPPPLATSLAAALRILRAPVRGVDNDAGALNPGVAEEPARVEMLHRWSDGRWYPVQSDVWGPGMEEKYRSMEGPNYRSRLLYVGVPSVAGNRPPVDASVSSDAATERTCPGQEQGPPVVPTVAGSVGVTAAGGSADVEEAIDRQLENIFGVPVVRIPDSGSEDDAPAGVEPGELEKALDNLRAAIGAEWGYPGECGSYGDALHGDIERLRAALRREQRGERIEGWVSYDGPDQMIFFSRDEPEETGVLAKRRAILLILHPNPESRE